MTKDTKAVKRLLRSELARHGKPVKRKRLLKASLESSFGEDLFEQALSKLVKKGEVTVSADGGKVTAVDLKKKLEKGAANDNGSISSTVDLSVGLQDPTSLNTILLFYAYIQPVWTKVEHDCAIKFLYDSLSRHGCTGRARVAAEGLNCTLTGPYAGIRAFTRDLSDFAPQHFSNLSTFKFVDNQPQSQLLKGLKVFPVSELVTYGFSKGSGMLNNIENGRGCSGNHLNPHEYHEAMKHPDAVMVDVRNFNESVIGKFQPPGTTVLDPQMRKSTEFPEWVKSNSDKLRGKKVLMYCTAGIRCERAAAFLKEAGIDDVNQLDGGIHRYLETFPEDGGFWKGKNYTFDKRFSHGATKSQVISSCVVCDSPWERYNAGQKCEQCKMEVLVCKECMMKHKISSKKTKFPKESLVCPLCRAKKPYDFKRHGNLSNATLTG
jgi:predicted sulfurtransferase